MTLFFARSEMGAPAAPIAMASASSQSITRTVQVDTTDALRFAPEALTVRTGETIAFDIHNSGSVPHEFFIGTADEQIAHEQEMASGMPMHDDPNGVDVPAGQTVRLVYTFNTAGTLEYGCHVPGHYAAGMRGTITIL